MLRLSFRNPASGGGYEHTQTVAQNTWTINHNLGYRPAVQLVGTNGSVFHADISHTSVNQVVVGPMTVARAGSARLS